MADFLDQEEIDRLQYELAKHSEKKEKSRTAKEKVKTMFMDVIKYKCPYEMNTLDDIGAVVNLINTKITTQSKYYESFTNLKHSYSNRLQIK